MERYEQYSSVLSECLLFRKMNAEEIKICLTGASPKVIGVEKNESVVLPEQMRDIYIVLSGKLNVVQDSGMNVSLAHVLTSGKCFGIAFCVENIPCRHTLQATEKSELLKLSYVGLMEQEDIKIRILENLLSITSGNLLVLAKKINHTQARSVRVKLSIFLRDQIEQNGTNTFNMDMSRKNMADYLNITYPAMLRELSQMQKDGILRISGDRITILNTEDLVDKGSEYNIL